MTYLITSSFSASSLISGEGIVFRTDKSIVYAPKGDVASIESCIDKVCLIRAVRTKFPDDMLIKSMFTN